MSKIRNTLLGLMVIGVVLLLNACVVVRSHPGYRAPVQPSVSYRYWYYYPNYDVYYHATEHYYYYLDGGIWRKVMKLPTGWVLRNESRVLLKIPGLPYAKHEEHRHTYPAKYDARRHQHQEPHRDMDNRDNADNRRRWEEHSDSDRPRHDDRDYGYDNNRRRDHRDHGVADGDHRDRERTRQELVRIPRNERSGDLIEKSPQYEENPRDAQRHEDNRDVDRGHRQARDDRRHANKPTYPDATERYNNNRRTTPQGPVVDNRQAVPAANSRRSPDYGGNQHPRSSDFQRPPTNRSNRYGNNSQRTADGVANGQERKSRSQVKQSRGKDKGKQKLHRKNNNADSRTNADSANSNDNESNGFTDLDKRTRH